MVEGRQRLNIDRGQQTDTPYTPCVERLAGGLGQYILIFADDDDRLLWVWQLPYSSIEFYTCVIGPYRGRQRVSRRRRHVDHGQEHRQPLQRAGTTADERTRFRARQAHGMRVVDVQLDDCLRRVATVLVGLVEGVAEAEEACGCGCGTGERAYRVAGIPAGCM